MFHAIRQWWGDGGGKSTLRLFLFEFLVVMAGVLAAQWLQQRQQELAMRDEARNLLANSRGIHESLFARSQHWRTYGPCVMARADAIALAAAEGRTMMLPPIRSHHRLVWPQWVESGRYRQVGKLSRLSRAV